MEQLRAELKSSEYFLTVCQTIDARMAQTAGDWKHWGLLGQPHPMWFPQHRSFGELEFLHVGSGIPWSLLRESPMEAILLWKPSHEHQVASVVLSWSMRSQRFARGVKT